MASRKQKYPSAILDYLTRQFSFISINAAFIGSSIQNYQIPI